jgi:hypothetical protein
LAVTTAIDNALSAISIDLSITLPLSALGSGGSLVLSATNVSLASLLAGTATLTPTLNCSLGALLCAAPELLAHGVIDPLVGTLGSAIEQPLGLSISGLVNPVVTGLSTTLDDTTSIIEDLLSTVLAGVFGPSSALSILINAQNAPDPAFAVAGNVPPTWASSLPGPTVTPYSTGQYDVSAIQLVVAGVAGGLTLDLARSSVGTNVLTP